MDHNQPSAPIPSQPSAEPDPDERALATLGYLGYLAGLWLVAPLVLYFLRRKHSRFVAHHAMRALVLHLLLAPLGLVLTLLTVSASAGVVAVLGPTSVFLAPLMVTLAFTGLAPAALLLVITLFAALRAYQGQISCTTRLGRAAEFLLRQDPGVIGE